MSVWLCVLVLYVYVRVVYEQFFRSLEVGKWPTCVKCMGICSDDSLHAAIFVTLKTYNQPGE